MGTQGLGRGLDDEELEPVWGEIERNGLVVFLHPHYGVPSSMWGGRDNGHVLPLALGFPFETTIVCFPFSPSLVLTNEVEFGFFFGISRLSPE